MEKAEQLIRAAEKYRNLIYESADYLWNNPECGYKEWKTMAYLAEQFEKLGYKPVKAGNIPGFCADADTGRPGPKIAVMGEMDALLIAGHPAADPETGAAHACGHHAQCAALLGLAAALKEPGAMDGLCGSVRFMCVPAEELIELEYRTELKKKGIIRYLSGKAEFISRGCFDGVDMAMMIHAATLREGILLQAGRGGNGCILKNITYKGKSAHAGSRPYMGNNALYAANCGINAANALRETFRDHEHVRFHPIITAGGEVVNAIPDEVRMESYIRGSSQKSMTENNRKINRALAGAAASMGCRLKLHDQPGYMPLNNDDNLRCVMAQAMELAAGKGTALLTDAWTTSCTDMGDVSSIMPVVHPFATGAEGTTHGRDFHIADREKAYLLPAKCLAAAVALLLENDADLGRKVVEESHPLFASKEEYLQALDRISMEKEVVLYEENGRIVLDLEEENA